MGMQAAAADESALDAAPFAEALETIRQQNAVPGLAAAAVREGEIVEIATCGVRKFGDPTAVGLEDAWHIGSLTKSMTASLAAMMVEEGKVKWTTTIGEILTGEKMLPAWRAVTLEQLLTHRGGVPGAPPPAAWKRAFERHGSAVEQRREFVRAILAEPPASEPGSTFTYSNQGYAIAGSMLEKIAGKPWEELIRQRLFVPLGMTTAGFGAPGSVGKIDAPWGHRVNGTALAPVPPGPNADNPPAIGPAGTVHCSIRDLARYAGWQARGGRAGKTLLSTAGFQKLHTPAGGGDYAMGWGVTSRPWAGGTALTHTGSNTMFLAVIWLAPEKDMAFVAATNVAGAAAAKACDDAVATLVRRLTR